MIQNQPRYIVLIYLVVASLWILLSDGVLLWLGVDTHELASISIIKGLGFVGITGLILYILLRHEFNKQANLYEALEQQLEASNLAQASLSDAEQSFRTVVESAPVPMMIFTESGEILAISRIWMTMTGYSRSQLASVQHWTRLAYGENSPQIQADIDKVVKRPIADVVDEGDFVITCQDESKRIWHFTSTSLSRIFGKERATMSIALDVTEQRQAEKITLENERLKIRFQEEHERNNLIQRIISTLSHDLRTALTVISTSRELLTHYMDRLSPEKRLERLEKIDHQVQYALQLLDDTVNIARGNLSENAFAPTPINIISLCRVSVDETLNSNMEVSHDIQFINHSQLDLVMLDEVLVTRILINLLSNAVKYSPENSTIRLELDNNDERIQLKITDEGMGIPEADVPNIFDLFYRTEAVKEIKKIKGTGLGLSIVKDCVERHQGTIEVTSMVGQGTTFTVYLPLKVVNGDILASA